MGNELQLLLLSIPHASPLHRCCTVWHTVMFFLTLNEGTKRERARKLNYCLGFRVILLKGGEKVTTSAWESFQAALKVVYILWREWFGSPESNCMSEKELFICLGEGGRKTSSSRGKQ